MSAGLTHPDDASLVDPLCGFAAKRVKKIKQNRSFPLSAAGEERVPERSDGRVSQPGGHYRLPIAIRSL